MKRTLQELAEQLGCQLIGDADVSVNHVSSLRSANSDSLVFVDDPKYLEAALASTAGAVIAGEFASNVVPNKPLLIARQPRLAFARAARLWSDSGKHSGGVHPTAIVPPSVHLGDAVRIGEHAVLGEKVKVGDQTTIGAGCVVGEEVRIGIHCRIDPRVTIYSGTTVGDRVVIQAGAVLGSDGFGYVRDAETGRYEQFPQVGRLVIEDDVEIGANSTVDRGALDETCIRRGTKIDNLVHVGHNCQIGCDVVIAAQTGLSGSVSIGDNVVMGGQVGIGDHARIEDGAIIGGQGGILPKKVVRGKGVVFWGTPVKPLREYLKELAFLSRAARKAE